MAELSETSPPRGKLESALTQGLLYVGASSLAYRLLHEVSSQGSLPQITAGGHRLLFDLELLPQGMVARSRWGGCGCTAGASGNEIRRGIRVTAGVRAGYDDFLHQRHLSCTMQSRFFTTHPPLAQARENNGQTGILSLDKILLLRNSQAALGGFGLHDSKIGLKSHQNN